MEKLESDQPKYDRPFIRADKVKDILDARLSVRWRMSLKRFKSGMHTIKKRLSEENLRAFFSIYSTKLRIPSYQCI